MEGGFLALLVRGAGLLIAAAIVAEGAALAFSAWRRAVHAERQRRLALEHLRQRVEAAMARSRAEQQRAALSWRGYRKFQVVRKVIEAREVVSFYLAPHDGRPLPPHEPGQYLTFRLRLPERAKPLVRCYSLSDSPGHESYRVTVKRIGPPAEHPEAPPGVASNFLHAQVDEGDFLDVMAPAGHFHLDPLDATPVVLVAGGIGITPHLAMLNAIVEAGAQRETWLFYGVHNREEQVMGEHLARIAAEHDKIRLKIAHSRPSADSVEGRDYHLRGHITVDLLKRELPSNNYRFYVCGPSAMMSDLTRGLRAWGVPQDHVLYESFGPASVQMSARAEAEQREAARAVRVTFERSGKSLTWRPQDGSLLDLAERHGVAIDYGCRAGNCGTCLTAIRSGDVTYLGVPGSQPEAGSCLACIAIPRTPLVLDA